MRLAGGGVDHVDPLLAQLIGLGHGGHGGGGLNAVDAFRQADGMGDGIDDCAHGIGAQTFFFLDLPLASDDALAAAPSPVANL